MILPIRDPSDVKRVKGIRNPHGIFNTFTYCKNPPSEFKAIMSNDVDIDTLILCLAIRLSVGTIKNPPPTPITPVNSPTKLALIPNDNIEKWVSVVTLTFFSIVTATASITDAKIKSCIVELKYFERYAPRSVPVSEKGIKNKAIRPRIKKRIKALILRISSSGPLSPRIRSSFVASCLSSL